MARVTALNINGKKTEVDVDSALSLLSVLRDSLDLTGTKYGCGEGQCGACTVLLDGQPTRSCVTQVGRAAGKQITTIEGLEKDGKLTPLQEAFIKADAMQCAYCTSGMLMAASALLAKTPRPNRDQIVEGMNRNICRCGVYQRIVEAIQIASGQHVAGLGPQASPPAFSTTEDKITQAGTPAVPANETMNDEFASQISIEPERYELFEASKYNFDLDRRDFIKTFGLGILFIVPLSRTLAQQRGQEESGRARGNNNVPNDVGAWIHIDEDGAVAVLTGKVEFGQNARTSLTQAVADELHVPMSLVHLIMGDTDLVPFDMGTFGSLTTPMMAPQLRKAAAAAREILIVMAAEQLKVQPADLQIVDARFVNHDKSKTLTFAEVAKGQKLVKVIPENIAITKASDWTTAGRPATKVNASEFVTGRHRYTSDVKRDGMLYGKILRPAAFNSTLVSVDTKAAEAVPGVKTVVDGDFIGIAAPSPETASKAVDAITVHWKSPGQPSNAELFDLLRKTTEQRGRGSRAQGSIADGLNAADKKLSETYTVAYIAHAPLEPRAAVAEWNGDKLTVWTGTQRPFGVRGELAEAFHIPEDKVRVIVPDTGSGYGGKHSGECAIEAARLARAANKPVKLVWTRAEEFTWAYFRPAGVIDVKSGVKTDGTITAWEFHNYNSGSSGIQIKYDIPNTDIQFYQSNSPLRQGSYRGLAATANHFARESHIDELASAVNMDPLEFRLKNTKDERLRDVLLAATKGFGWGKTKPSKDRGYGLSCGFEKGGYIATCAEVTIDRSGKGDPIIRIVRVVEAFDCGAIVNPLHLKNQIEGAIVQSIGGALFESIKFENGNILNPHFAQYRVPRFSDTPSIEVVLVDRKDLPSAGAGETPIVGLAPAVANAIFNATGTRIRSLPLAPNGISTATFSTPFGHHQASAGGTSTL